MAEYELGTAHGRIVVDYDDKGVDQANRSFDRLKERLAGVMRTAAVFAKRWDGHVKTVAQGADTMASRFALVVGAAAAITAVVTRGANAFLLFEGASHIVESLGVAMGSLPEGAENFPDIIKDIIRLSAAISLFAGSASLVARLTRNVRGLRVLGGLFNGLGAQIFRLAAPIRAVSGLFLGLAFQIAQFRFVKSIIKVMSLLTGAVGALGGTVHVISGLAASIRDLSKAALLLPAIIGAAGLAMGTFKIATLGVSDALKAMDDPAKFAEALKKLSPAAREAVLAVKGLQGQFKEIQQAVQNRFFEGLGKVISDLGSLYLPILQGGLEDVAGSFNRTIKEVAAFFNTFEGSNEVANDFAEGLAFSAKGIDNLLKTVAPLTRAFYLLWRVGSEVFAEITGGAEAAAKKFEKFIGSARASGDLARWMREGVQAVKDLIRIVLNLGKILTTVFDGLNQGSGKTFLGVLREGTEQVLAFLKSAEGQSALKSLGDTLERIYTNTRDLADAFIKYLLPAFQAFAPFLEALSGGVTDGLISAFQILGPIFQGIGTVLSEFGPVIRYIVAGMVSFAAIVVGLGLALKVLGGALFIAKVGIDAAKFAFTAVSFGARLLMGRLTGAERAVLRFAGMLGRTLLRALFSVGTALRLLKFGAVIAGIYAVQGALKGYSDEVNATFEKGDFGQDVLTFWEELKQQPFEAIGKEIRASLTPPDSAAADFKAAGDGINAFFDDMEIRLRDAGTKIGDSFQKDFIGFFAALPGQVGGWLTRTGEKISQSFQNDFIAPVTAFPGRVVDAITGLGQSLYQSATDAWNQFKLASEAKFVELGGQAGSLPYRIGRAIGSLIGMGLKWAYDLWTSFKTASETKINEFTTWLGTLPGRFGAWALGLLAQGVKWATDLWDSFRTTSQTKTDEAVADVEALPGRIGTAISDLGTQLQTEAETAWSNFTTTAQGWIDQAIADAQALPGRISSYLSGLAGQLGAIATGAWQRFQTAAIAWINQAIADIQALPGRAAAALSNIGNTLYQSGVNLIQGFINGVSSMIRAAADAVRGVVDGVRQYFPFSPAKKGPFSGRGYTTYSGQALIADFAKGMQSRSSLIADAAAAAMTAANLTGAGMGKDLAALGGLGSQFNLGGRAAPAVGASPATMPTSRPVLGSDGAASSEQFTIGRVEIPAKDVQEMKDVADFFGAVKQKARAGRAGSK